MTVSSSTDRATFPGNGATQIFPLPFRFFANSEIQAWLVTNATGALTALTLGTHYTLSGAADPEVDGNPTSELTMLTAPTALQSLFVQRVIPLTQPTDIVNQGRFFPEIHENVFDRLTMLMQQVGGDAERAIRVQDADPEPGRLPPVVQRAGKLLSFDDFGNPVSVAAASQSATELALDLADILDLSSDTIQQASTGNLWTGDTPPAKINRINDRLFIGDLADNDGANPTVSATWAGQLPQPGYDWVERNATAGSYASKGAIGFVGAAHTEELVVMTAAAIGLVGIGLNDNPTTQTNAWAQYLDAKSNADALGPTWGTEIEITNLGAYVGDYDADTRKTFGVDVGAGGDPSINGATDSVTFGLRFFSNGATFGAGISFGAGSLRLSTDAAGESYYRAMVLRNTMALVWEGSAGEQFGSVRNTCTTQATQTAIRMRNNNIDLRGAGGANIAQFGHVASGVNHVSCSNAVAGQSPTYSVAGADADIDVRFIPKGTGLVRFGTMVGSADVAIIGSVSIKDSAGNIRKLAVIA